MSTDRFQIDQQVCECGQGQFVVDRCEPSHGWVRPSQIFFEGTVVCATCTTTYDIVEQDGVLIVALKSELQEREHRTSEAAHATREFMARSDVQSILLRFGEKLDTLRSKAEVHRYLRQLGFETQSQSSFSSKWKGGTTWATKWRSIYDVQRALPALGISDPDLTSEMERISKLWFRGKLTVIRELRRRL